ncbi:DUF3987 domain-containing protein [Vibrio parahaemolyticus]|nr:DUF3987 domain-containing protein [Vibrio parahaemolyticus]EJG0753708.1 DUF3987 domain-containing protein [Vibrio parahaemolyticus]
MKHQNQSQSIMEKSNEDSLIKIRPELRNEGFYGLAGKAALCLCDGFRALPELVFLSLLARIAASINKGNVIVKIGSQTTELRLNALLIMRTGGGKGMGENRAQLLIERSKLFAKSGDESSPLFARVHEGGLSTTEGIVNELRDDYQGKNGEIIHGIADKRLCVVEEEFANIFIKCRSSNSNLSTTIRKLFDGANVSPLTKHDRISCTNPHVCIVGHITPREFISEVNAKDLFNGFSNRFITVLGIPKPAIAFPKELDANAIDAISAELSEAIEWCNDEQRTLEMSECCRELWEPEFEIISDLGPHDSLEANLMVRAPHYALIISGLFAALDKSCILTVKHLKAALAWIDYWHDSIRYVFDTEAEAEANKQRIENSELVLAAIKEVVIETGLKSFKRTLLSKKLSRKVSTEVANRALQDLQERPIPPISVNRTGSKNCQIITLH